jgi:hypothetical protein
MSERLQLAEHRIEDERPVGGRQLDRRVGTTLPVDARQVGDLDRGRLAAAAEEGEGFAADLCKRGGIVFDDILARRVREEKPREAGEISALAAASEELAGRRDPLPLLLIEPVRQLNLPDLVQAAVPVPRPLSTHSTETRPVHDAGMHRRTRRRNASPFTVRAAS